MKPCNSCPFRKNTTNFGSADWLADVMKGLMIGQIDHSCHKTDPKADGYVGHKVGKDSICMGMVGMLKKQNNNCYDTRVSMALVKGELDWKDIETKNVFNNSKQFVAYQMKKIFKNYPEMKMCLICFKGKCICVKK